MKIIENIKTRFHRFPRHIKYPILSIPAILTSLIIFGPFSTEHPQKPPKIINAPTNSLYFYEAGNENFKANIGSKNTTAPFVQISTGDSSIAFSLNESKSISAQKIDNVVVYENVRENTNVTYTSLQNGIKEEIILSSPPKDNEYIFTLTTDNVHPREITGNNFSRYFFNNRNEYQFHLEEPFAIDAKGNRTDDVGMFIRKSELNENQYQLRLVVPKDWLESKDRVYPVIIDPTVVHNTGAEFALGTLNRAFADTSQNNGAPTTELTQDANTVGLYHFNETANDSCAGSADACDSSGNGNHGVATGTTISTTASPLNNSRTFATSNTVALNNESNFDFERTSTFSIEAWVRTSNTGVQTIVSKLDSNSPYSGYELWINNDGTVRAYLTNTFCTNCISVRTTTTVNDGQWHHVAMTYSGSSTAAGLNIYIDGVAQSKIVDSDVLTGSIQNNIPVQIGSRNGVVYYFIGTIDEVQITNDVRSGAEIAADAARGPAISSYYQELPTDEHTVGLWHLNEATDNSCSGGQDACDSSGNGYHGSDTGGSTPNTTAKLSAGRSFDGANDRILITDNDALSPSAITVEAWVYMTGLGTNDLMIGKGGEYWISYNSAATGCTANKFGFSILSGTWSCASSNFSPSINTWYHIAGVYDGAYITIYINGELVGGPTAKSTYAPTANAAAIGGWDGTGTYETSAIIDEVRFSNIARSTEEIKSSASRRPYSTYTSPVLDLDLVESWTSLLWDEIGVNTGDGETLKSSNYLIAQWNFNETSGTVADNAAGSCGASCDGSLSGFDSTASQDADPDSGWTANNRRWGAGALQFDGIDSFISVPHHTTLNPITAVTLEAWYNPSSIPTGTADNIIDKRNAADGTVNYLMQFLTSGLLRFYATGPTLDMSSNSLLPIGQWNHIVMTYDGSTANIYINGKLDKSGSYTGNLSTATDNSLKLCRHGSTTTAGHCHGVLDSTRIYSHALSAFEILNNYNVGNIELQTRVGSTATADDGSWQEWRPVTSETQISAFDSSITDSLISFWKLDEVSAGSAAVTRYDSFGLNNLQDLNTTPSIAGILNYGINPTGASTEYIRCTDANCGGTGSGKLDFTASDSFSYSAWVKSTTTATNMAVFGKRQLNSSTTAGYSLFVSSTGDTARCEIGDGTNVAVVTTASDVIDGGWHHVVCVVDRSAQTITRYVDGTASSPVSTTSVTNTLDTTYDFRVGITGGNNTPFTGQIDEIGVWKRALTSTEVTTLYSSGSPKNSFDGSDLTNLQPHGGLRQTSDTVINTEGTASQKITTGQLQLDDDTLALWRLDETNGDNAGDDIFDTSSSGLDGEINGTNLAANVVTGISGKAREFNGTDDYIDFGDVTTFDGLTQMTISAWINLNSTKNSTIVGKADHTGSGNAFFIRLYSADGVRFSVRDITGYQIDCDTGEFPPTNQWTLITAVLNTDDTCQLYFNGVQKATGSNTSFASIQNNTIPLRIGQYGGASNYFFDGVIDEVKISNTAATAEQIAANYRLGQNNYINQSIASTDLSAKKSLPFYVAADRPGSYLSATIGESAYANYQPDANTMGLWHLEENDAKHKYDLSGTTIDVDEWVEIDPGANKISQNNGIILSAGTVAAWDSALVSQQYFPRTQGQTLYTKITPTSGSMMVGWANNSTTIASYTNITHALYLNGGNIRIYQDGTIVGTYLSGYSASTAYEFKIALTTANTASYYIKGGAYTSWTLILQADSTKSNTPLRVQIATHQFAGTFSDITVYNSMEAQDSSGNNNDGNMIGPISNQGKIGRGKTFDGSSDLIQTLATNIPSGTTGQDLTADFWIYPTDLTVNRGIISRGGFIAGVGFDWSLTIESSKIWIRTNGSTNNGTINTLTANQWYHVAVAWDVGTGWAIYVNGVKWDSATNTSTDTSPGTNSDFVIGASYNGAVVYQNPFVGTIDEVRISNVIRTADEIRQAYEVGLRTHPITIDFGAALDSGNLITGSGDLSFTVDATVYGLTQKGSQLFPGDKIIVRENYNGTEYIAQGTVTGVTASTGAVTVVSWDTGSTFPSGGYTIRADVFKWQREYFDINNITLDSHLNAITRLSLRLTGGNEGRTIWLDDLRSVGDYLTSPAGSTITSSTDQQYFQYRATLSSSDESVSPSVSSITLDYTINTAPNTPTLNTPSDTATGISLAPILQTTSTDADSDYLRYKIELCTDLAMTANCQTFDQTASQTGWSGQNAQTGTAYASGTQATYTIQTPLTGSTTYYWRSYAIDPGGLNTFSATQSPPHSFTTSGAPGLPTQDTPTTGSTGVTTTPTLRTTAIDPNGDALRYRVKICTDANMTLNCQVFTQSDSQVGWSGQNALTGTAYTSGTQAVYTLQTQLITGVTYWWRSDAIDPLGSNSYGPTQNTAFFTVIDAPQPPAPCTVEKAPDNSQIIVNWTDISATESGYQVWRSVNDGLPAEILPNLGVDVEIYTDTNVASGNSYLYMIRSFQIEGTNTIYSNFCNTSKTNLSIGSFQFEGVKLEGLQID